MRDLPLIHSPADLQPNTTPHEGVAVLLDYNLAHIAIVEEIQADGFIVSEKNYSRDPLCPVTTRFIRWGDRAIRGFYDSSSTSR